MGRLPKSSRKMGAVFLTLAQIFTWLFIEDSQQMESEVENFFQTFQAGLNLDSSVDSDQVLGSLRSGS
jgi:hypothetical protein